MTLEIDSHVEPRSSVKSGAADSDEEGFSLTDLLVVIGEEKVLFISIAVIGMVMSVVWALTVPRYFTANTIVMPPQQQQGAGSAALAQLGALANLAGASGQVKAPDELYAALLRSRSIQDMLIKRFNLMAHYEAHNLMETRFAIAYATSIATDKKTGLISIEVDDLDAKMAADMANAYVDSLQTLLSTLAVTDAQQRRVFLEKQVEKTKKLLVESELAFKQAQAKSGLVVTQVLAEAGVRASIDLRTQIASREVQLQSLSRYATEQSAEVRQVSAELAALRQQLRKFEGGGGNVSTPGDTQAAVEAYRNVKVFEAELETLLKQFEIAKIDESKEGPLLQQVDIAVPPERALKPRRSFVAMVGAVASVLIGLMLALLRRFWRLRGQSDQTSGSIGRVIRAWKLRT